MVKRSPSWFRFLRHAQTLTQEEFGKKVGVTARQVRRWEAGVNYPRKVVMEIMNDLTHQLGLFDQEDEENGLFTFIDLFAGIGGFRKGFELVGGSCVFTCEWNDFSRRTYEANFSINHRFALDITKVDEASVPEHDVLLAGFPCQPFSIAGVSKKNSLGHKHGFECTTQGTLFFDIERIIRAKRPLAFVLENVKNLKSHDGGNTYKTIRRVLKEDLGYHVTDRIIDAKSFVPQHRERIFIIGFRKDVGFDAAKHINIPKEALHCGIGDILHGGNGKELVDDRFIVGSGAQVNPRYTLSDKLWDYLKKYAEKHRAKGNGFGFGLVGKSDIARTLSARYFKDGSEILVKQKRKNPRRLTPRECARLMGFDSNGDEFKIPVSDTQAYKQFGNAVVVPVVVAVAEAMKPFVLKLKEEEVQEESKEAKNEVASG